MFSRGAPGLPQNLTKRLVCSGGLVVVVVIYNNDFCYDVCIFLNSTSKPGTKCGWYEVVLVGV